jgi:Methane/Phenol/Toluene Hydroxylase
VSTAPDARSRSSRDLLYIRPRRRRLSEYEAVTCYAQRSPEAFDIEGWFTLGPGPEHRPAFRAESTRLVHPHWYDFRDPAEQWQRTYVRMQAEQERAIQRVTEDAARDGGLAEMNPEWLERIIVGHYRLWAHLDYALFRAFGVLTREALSDTIGNVLCFQAFDHSRHAQAIVLHLLAIEESVPDVRDEGAKQRWLDDPMYQPMRRLAEHLMLTIQDWAELPIVVNLVVQPILAEVGLSQLVRRLGSHHGDPVTPFIVTTAERDRTRNLAYTEELVRMVTASDIPDARANREVIHGWIEAWTPAVLEATLALRPLFDAVPVDVVAFDSAFDAAVAAQRSIIESLGLAAAPTA